MNKFEAENSEEIINDNNKNSENGKPSADFIRHSVSSYKTYADIVSSDKPLEQLNPNNQSFPDLPEKGIEFAKQEAEKFFAGLEPKKDVIFFASSNEARAIETANIYRQIAHQKGFEILKPEHSRNEHAEEIGEGEIRVVKNLSIYPDKNTNILIDSVFNSPKKRSLVNWQAVPTELKERYDRASKIIEADDKGSFGQNLAAHSEEIKKILPEISTAEELYKGQFQNILRLIKFGLKKAESSKQEKQVKIIAFGHENYLMHMLEKSFQEDGIKNCEAINLNVEDGIVKAKFRNKEAKLE
ncbi:MAG: hypothetical protein WCF92_00960 [bacterium]